MSQQKFTTLPTEEAIGDKARLNALYNTGLLDSQPEKDFDRLTGLAKRLLNVRVSLVSLVDRDRQFFKSSQGLPEPWASSRQTSLSRSFCQHVVSSRKPLIISDARNHPLVCKSQAIQDLGVIGYLGIPLSTIDGQVIGSLCAITDQPRIWSDDDIDNLTDLAALTMKEIEVRFHLCKLHQTEKVLQKRTQELQKSNRELEQFTHALAHDMGNPLNTISVSSELLRKRYEDLLDDKGQALLAALARSSNRMEGLLQDLRDYARAGHYTFEAKPVNLAALIESAREDLNAKIIESQAQIHLESLPMVIGDETYLRLLFQNLLENAIKYRGEQAPLVEVTAAQVAECWHISIYDNGVGIAPNNFKTIFEPFKRGCNTQQKPGSGIGLATCKRIVERHDGNIWVESELGKGSVFHFSLPIVKT